MHTLVALFINIAWIWLIVSGQIRNTACVPLITGFLFLVSIGAVILDTVGKKYPKV